MSNASTKKISETIDGYKRLIDIIISHQDADTVCRLSKKEISTLYGISYTGTLKKINFLLKYGLLEKVNGGLRGTDRDVIQQTPLSLLSKILILVLDNPEIYSSFKKQSELLDVPYEDIQSAWGFYGYFFGSKYPNKDELKLIKENGLINYKQ